MADDHKKSVINLRSAVVTRRSNGLIEVFIKRHITTTIEDARDQLDAISELVGSERKAKILVDIRQTSVIAKEVRDFFATETTEFTESIALLADSSISKIIANLFINFSSLSVPIRVFSSKTEAVSWLLGRDLKENSNEIQKKTKHLASGMKIN